MDWTALIVFIVLFVGVTVVGFFAARWRRGDLHLLDEWGLAGRRFGTVITWFLLGGDIYTAYTFIAVPALMFGAGAIGFFAVPYTIIIYPFAFLVFPKLWQVAKRHGFVTASDFIHARYGSSTLALAVVLYPHSVTAILSSESGNTIRRNMAMLPAYTLVLGLLALLGFMALAAGVRDMPEYASYFARYGTNFAVPALLMSMFPSWFLGIALAAIGIGALVPAAIMSIAAANLYTRNIHRAYF